MQKTRLKLLKDLEAMFNMAKGYAESKDPKVTPKQRQIWMRIMAYIGQVINSISKSFDEAQISEDLERLEKLVNEAVAKEKGGRAAAAG
jgi:ArsR family metal-binding transcriptional regulator